MSDAWSRQRDALDAIVARTSIADRLANDPVGLVRAAAPEDREVVAHIAAALAYGAVAQIRKAIGRVLAVLGDGPTEALRSYQAGDFLRREPDFVYRMTRAEDIDAFLFAIAQLLREFGTLGAAFACDHHATHDDTRQALGAYVARFRRAGNSERRGFYYLTPDPRTGSSTKRWHLLLRWLARPDDGVDLGLWPFIPTRQLILPIDRHIEGIVRNLGWVQRATADARFAIEATERLRSYDAADPLRYDFALCHMGIARQCRHTWVADICTACPMQPLCLVGRAEGALT